jgi:hypothetical protein
MAKFTVYSSETVYYQNYVEADTAEEAREFRVDVDTYADEAEKIYLRLSFVLTETDNYD